MTCVRSVTNSKKTKELNLTHNLIADKAGFRNLMDIYDKDQILKYIKRIKDYIKNSGIKEDLSDKTFGEVIDFVKTENKGTTLNKVDPTPKMKEFIDNNPDLYQQALNTNYAIFSRIYINKDQLGLNDKKQNEDNISKRGSKRDYLIKHLFKIQKNLSLYKNKEYNEFLRITDFRHRITSIESKRILQENIDSLINVENKTIEEIINDAHEKEICLIDENLERFIHEKQYIYNRVKKVKFSEFQKLYKYLEGFTPFSTQHKTKGSEFDNVFVILDNGNWNKYNFRNLFLNTGSKSVLERTQKIFYVCCTRAKENLAVFYHNPSQPVIEKAAEWFGKENTIEL